VGPSILPVFLLDEGARGEDTTFVIHRGVISRGAPPFLKERVGCSFLLMPRNLKRHYGKGDLHFIPFGYFKRRPLLGTARARNLFVKVMGELRERYGFMLIGYVLMPEHVHLLMSEPK
jgi:hypothetical protein